MEKIVREVGRLGDYGTTPVLIMKETETGMFVQVTPVVLNEKESITFASPGMGGGRSLKLVAVLRELFGVVIDEKMKIFLCAEDCAAICFFRKDGSDFLVKTGRVDSFGLKDVGCEVFFARTSNRYEFLIRMFNAIEVDNKAFPVLGYIF